MPKVKENIRNCKHPNSRKTTALAKKIKKASARQKKKVNHYLKQNLIAEKLLWFRDNLEDGVIRYSPEGLYVLINKYLSRFDSELQQIQLKQSIGYRKTRQHASREDIINLTKKRELEEYNTSGIEIPDILDPNQLKVLQEWNGELRYLQNINMRRISKCDIIKLIHSQKNNESRISM